MAELAIAAKTKGYNFIALTSSSPDSFESFKNETGAQFDFFNADEVFITANSLTMFSVAKLNNRVLGNPIPGPMVKKLFVGWNKMVGIDCVQQCLKHLND